MKSILRNFNRNYNFKLLLIFYMILNISSRYINAAPTTNSPSKMISPSINNSEQIHNQNKIQLLLSEQTTQHNGDNFEQLEISTTTTVPIFSTILNKNIENDKYKTFSTIDSTTAMPSVTSTTLKTITQSSENPTTQQKIVTTDETLTTIEPGKQTKLTSTNTVAERTTELPQLNTSTLKPISVVTEQTVDIKHHTTTKKNQKLRKSKNRTPKKLEDKASKSKTDSLKHNHTPKNEKKIHEDIHVNKLFEKSTTTTATTTAMTIENTEPKTMSSSFIATTNSEPIMIDYLTTVRSSPMDELLQLNDQQVEEALLLTKKDVKTTEKPIHHNKKKHEHNLKTKENHKTIKTTATSTTTATTTTATNTELTPNGKPITQHTTESKKSKHYENKKSHTTYKKKLRPKNHISSHSKTHSETKHGISTSSTPTISSTVLPFAPTTNDMSNPTFLPTTNDASSSSISTSSADPFSKLNTKTVNPFRHQEAIDDISVSDTVSATTLETTTVETPLAMASATTTHQTTSAGNFQLKLKQTPNPSTVDEIDENNSKFASASDDLITTYSTQLQLSSSPSQQSTIRPILHTVNSQTQTSIKDQVLISTEVIPTVSTIKDTSTTISGENLSAEETSTEKNKILKMNKIPLALATSSSQTLVTTEKELSSISTTNPIIKHNNVTPLRGTTKSFETSSSPTTFMAQDQLKYAEDDGNNVELVTTKFITSDNSKISSSKNIETKKIDSLLLPTEMKDEKFISTPLTTEASKQLIYERKNRLQSINEYKIDNSGKIHNKDTASANDSNENSNFNTIVQFKDIFPYKMTATELSTTTTTSVDTQNKVILKENEISISTSLPIISTNPIAIDSTTASTTIKPKSSTSLYSTLKNTFRAIHTPTGSSMEKDISILDSGVKDTASTATIERDGSTQSNKAENNYEHNEQMKLYSTEVNFSDGVTTPLIRGATATVGAIANQEKLIKLTDIENIDSSELIKSEALVKHNDSHIEISLKPTKNPKEEITNNSQGSIGHDGLKATKKKQLLDKHFKTLNTKINDELIPEHKLGPLHMKETVLRPKSEDTTVEPLLKFSPAPQDNIQNSDVTSAHLNLDKSQSTETLPRIDSSILHNLASPKTSTESDNESTVMLNIDLISEPGSQHETSSFLYDTVSKIQPPPTTNTKTTTESEYIKHKNYEKSLIPKLEWIPIASVEHIDFSDSNHLATPSDASTIMPQFASDKSTKLKSQDQLSDDLSNSRTKSLEIELVEPTKTGTHQSQTVPEFFEIAKPISANQNIKANGNDKENSESSPIEIQINVSEGFGNENENLEFSFRQMHSENSFKPIKVAHTMQNPPPGFQEIGEITIQRSIENQGTDSVITAKPIKSVINKNLTKSTNNADLNPNKNNEAEEILQVEITAIDNSTGIESFNEPKFTLHSEPNLNRNRDNDDFFIPDLKLESIDELKELNRQSDNFGKDALDSDSDTIFYISNTEVKVAESKPTPNTLYHSEVESLSDLYRHRNKTAAEINRSKLESQFFPTIYEEDVRIDVGKTKNSTYIPKQTESDRYEEDIILSPIKNNFDSLKMEINSQANNFNENSAITLNTINSDSSYPLSSSAADVSYVGETLIEIEESTNANPAIPPLDLITSAPISMYDNAHRISTTKKDNDIPLGMIIAGESAPIDDLTGENTSGALLSDVIIQPAIIPEMSIGVPVIGELPPQIELKEIDYIPNLTNGGSGGDGKSSQQMQQQQQQSDQIDGGAIQYGGDLISDDDTSGSAGSRYVFESSYPFGDERIRKVGRLRNEQNFDNDASDIDDNDSNSSSRDDDNFNTPNRNNVDNNKNGNNNDGDLNNIDNSGILANHQQIVMHAVNSNFQKEQFIADFPSYDTLKEIPHKRNNIKENDDINSNINSNYNTKTNSEEIVNSTAQAILNNAYNTTLTSQPYGNSSSANSTEPEQLGNATAFIIMDDTEGNIFDLTDIQTLLIACFATLIPLVLSLLLAFAVRYLWKKYRRDDDPDEEGGLVGDTSIDPMSAKTGALSQDELRTTESGYTLNRSNDTLDTNATDLDGVANAGLNSGKIMANHCTGGSGGGGVAINNANNNNCGANGSVITMTLKNNHLIVETEERNDISRDARETKMHYNSSDKDGVFVVEVARGADTTGVPNSPYKENHIGQKACSLDGDKSKPSPKNHEEVQIHQPPSDNFDNDNPPIAKSATISELDEANFELEERGINIGISKTGLSQSDLSSSSNDSNKGYNYGKQELYTAEAKVYNPTSPKQKVSSDSLDSIKDKSENDFGDNCDTETSPCSRECSNDSDNGKHTTNKGSEKFTGNQKNSGKNYKSNDTECNTDNIEKEITNNSDEKIDTIKLNEEKNDIENKENSVNLENDNNKKEDKSKQEEDKDVKKSNQIDNESIKNPENETENLTTTKNNTETIETNESLPPPPPQFNNDKTSSSPTTAIFTNSNKDEDEYKEKSKDETNNRYNENDIKNSSKTSATESEIVKLENDKKLDKEEDENIKGEKTGKKIIHQENGLDDHQHHQQHNNNNNSNNTTLTNGHYEKQNGIIHNHDNDSDNDIDLNSNKDETIILNDDKKMNGNINDNNTDTDRTIILSSNGVGHENGFDSILSLPDPPSTEEIIQMNDIILMENSQLDSLPPPPPLDTINNLTTSTTTTTIIPATTTGDLIGNCNNEEIMKNSINSDNCGIDTNNLNDIKNLLNGDHHNNIIDEHKQQIHQNGIGGTQNGTTATLVAVNGSS
ncbi:serine-rich adhesin for platelets isoform X2 [Condylostylus longicornis]|uniref:serine-rich adhesin for platelets isoform X2 n=1 Tax=Condylostylus longicornis TaxID=2530218 RepID=UPI00244DB682|nr:serine-rich adhesin for platelets isoform X2 [Condylostylus longicornis]